MKAAGIVLIGRDAKIEARAKREKLPVLFGDYSSPPWERTLFVRAGTAVPWDLVPFGFHFIERWDAAVPLWRYGVLAQDVGGPAEQTRTKAIVRDLRVLLYSHELLFVRNSEAGQALMRAFVEELGETPPHPDPRASERLPHQNGGEGARLAFLRAMYRTKPRLCVLPRSWLADVLERSEQDARTKASTRRAARTGVPLVRVEITPGRFVQCYRGDEEKVKADFAKRKAGRRR